MNMKYWKAGLLFLTAFFVQTSLLNLLSIAGCTPNLILCMVVVLSFLYENEMYGVVFGAVFGLLYDICYSSVIGPTAISLVLVAILILVLREYANIENIVNMWVISAVSIVLYYGLNWGLFHMAGNPIGIVYVIKDLPGVFLYSLAVVTLIYLILIRKAVKHRRDRYFK